MEKLHIGTMGWSYRFWVNNFYSSNLDPKDYLSEYSKHFDTVEVDSTFYRVPYPTTVRNWVSKTPDSFMFSQRPLPVSTDSGNQRTVAPSSSKQLPHSAPNWDLYFFSFLLRSQWRR